MIVHDLHLLTLKLQPIKKDKNIEKNNWKAILSRQNSWPDLFNILSIFNKSRSYPVLRLNQHGQLRLVCRIDVHARLLILRKKFPPARPYLGLHVYWFWEKNPPCTCIRVALKFKIKSSKLKLLTILFRSLNLW